MPSATLKQASRLRFLRLCELYRDAKKRLDSPEGRLDFVRLSLAIHAAKADVPKYMWRLAK